MSLSPGQAAAALDEIERTERRTHDARGYAIASPYLILWGLIWAAGYGACAFLPPERWGTAWLPLVAIGALGSTWLGLRTGGGSTRGGGKSGFGQAAAIGAAVFVFIASTYYVLKPASPLAYLVFPALCAGLVYTLAGAVARMARFAWIGGGIFLFTMGGYVFAPQWLSLIIAVAVGGGLALGGLWLRKA